MSPVTHRSASASEPVVIEVTSATVASTHFELAEGTHRQGEEDRDGTPPGWE